MKLARNSFGPLLEIRNTERANTVGRKRKEVTYLIVGLLRLRC